jgi:transcriptional regulator with XRE-family HTH domain
MITIGPSNWTIPDARLGEMLTRARSRTGATTRDLAERSDGRFSVRLLRRIEDGRVPMLASDLVALAEIYGLDIRELVAARAALEVDLPHGTMNAGGTEVHLESNAADDVLGRYLTVIRELRSAPARGHVELREGDVETLAQALGLDQIDVSRRLSELMGCSQEQANRAWSMVRNRAVVTGAASLMIGAVAVSALSFSAKPADAATNGAHATRSSGQDAALVVTRPQPATSTPGVEIGTAMQEVREPDGSLHITEG